MTSKSKLERRFIQISRILRKRNYGLKKGINGYSGSIYKAVYTKTGTDEAGRAIYNQLSGKTTESLSDVFASLNKRLDKLFPKIAQYLELFLQQGSRKVFDKNGMALKLKIPSYVKVIDKLQEDNLKYVKDITDAQRKLMVDEISKGIKSGKTYSQMADDIQSKVEGISKSRAELIANNEAHKAHARAMEDTMRHNGITKYQWLTADDNRVSPICQSYHRKVFEYR